MAIILRRSTLYALLAAFVALEIGDVLLTGVLLAHGSYEANPFMAQLIARGGVFALFIMKLMLLDVIVAIVLLFDRFWPRMTRVFLVLAVLAMAVVDLRSVLMVVGAG